MRPPGPAAAGAASSPFCLALLRLQEPLLGNGSAAGGGGGEQRPLGGTGATSSAPETPQQARLRRRIRFAMGASMVANVALLLAKIVAYVLSRSKAVLASTADSFVDIASQVLPGPWMAGVTETSAACADWRALLGRGALMPRTELLASVLHPEPQSPWHLHKGAGVPQVVIAIAEYKMARADPRFPVGRTRLETVGAYAAAVCCMRCCWLPVKRGPLQDSTHEYNESQLSASHKCGMGTSLMDRMWWRRSHRVRCDHDNSNACCN